MQTSAAAELAADAMTQLTKPVFVSVGLGALLLFLVSTTRASALSFVCLVYVALVHCPFNSSPTDFFLSGNEAPLPPTNSLWSRLQALSTLKWLAQSRRARNEKDIDWDQGDAVKDGDLIEAWDRIVEWDSRCLHPNKLEQLRGFGDPLADNAIDEIEGISQQPKQNSSDALRKIYDQSSMLDRLNGQRVACLAFWRAVDRRPPPGAGALGLDWYESRYGHAAVTNLKQWPRFPSSKRQEPDASLPAWTPYDQTTVDAKDESAELLAEAEVIQRGKNVFYRYAGPMLTILLHFSLAGGFASPRITEVLAQTAYLVPTANSSDSKDRESSDSSALPTVEELRRTFKIDKARAARTWSRLLETTQFVLDVVEKADSLHPPSISAALSRSDPVCETSHIQPPELGGEGWQAAVRVRLLHAIVRRRILKLVERRRKDASVGSTKSYDIEKNGIPINQEDLLGTLCAFSSAPLVMLQRFGVQPTTQERKDYIALWRHIGFYMGIEPALLRCAFVDAQAADRALFCTILHLFKQVEISASQHGNQTGAAQPRRQTPTIPVLIACADRPPFYTPLSAHVAIARRLLGKSMADFLALPASSARREVLTDLAFVGMQVPILFGRFYPRKSWEKRKLELVRPLLRRLVVYSLGNKRTRFEMPSSLLAESQKKPIVETVNIETQSHAHIDVAEDKEHNLRLAREWRWLMREMLAVLWLAASLILIVGAFAVLQLCAYLHFY